jgi:hypothetical protein
MIFRLAWSARAFQARVRHTGLQMYGPDPTNHWLIATDSIELRGIAHLLSTTLKPQFIGRTVLIGLVVWS